MSKSSSQEKERVLKEWLLTLKQTQERVKNQEISYKQKEY